MGGTTFNLVLTDHCVFCGRRDLSWSSESPKEPGWYWHRIGAASFDPTEDMRYVWAAEGDFWAEWERPLNNGGYEAGPFAVGEIGGEWAGPIPFPQSATCSA